MASEQEKKWIKNKSNGSGKSSRRNTWMSRNEFLTISLYQLDKLCQNGEINALNELKRRWETDNPNIAEIKKPQGIMNIPYFKK
jgi:hypothetical protein